ncbi:MAG: hypothetical protein CM1200mP41_35870 [Gammaproteobacteria bacterium]|nr:MAG: hypothetical protein CM1200mP41_35870 [Gammaproteobacteria bacterium]
MPIGERYLCECSDHRTGSRIPLCICSGIQDICQRTPLGIILLDHTFLHKLPVRIYSWQIFLGENGVINKLIGMIGFGPYPKLTHPLAPW